MTAAESPLRLCVAIDYSSRDAIARAAMDAVTVLSGERSSSADAMRPVLDQALTAAGGVVDLLIRTDGENVCQTFCCGNRPMPNSCSRTACGPILTKQT